MKQRPLSLQSFNSGGDNFLIGSDGLLDNEGDGEVPADDTDDLAYKQQQSYWCCSRKWVKQ